MSWSKSLLVVGIVLALIGGTSFASVTYSLDSGTSGGGITWGTGYLFSLNLFTTNFSANVLDQLQVAWGNLAPGTAAQVVLIELPNNNLSFPNNSRGTNILQDISTTVTAGEANGTSLTFDGNNTSYFLDPNNGNAPTTITNPTWTTYNITPTTITTPYFAVCTIVYDTDPGSVAPTLLDWGQGGSNSGGTNVPGPAISWLGFGGSSNSQYDLWFYNNFGGNQGTVEFFSGYGYFNNPFLIRAADTTGDSAPVTFWWYDVSNSATFNWNNSGSQNNWSTTGADGQGGVFPVGGAFPNRIDDIVNIGTANATIDLGGATITLGTMNVSSWMWNCCLTNLQNGTLNFQVSSGSALLNDQKDPWAWNPDLISANVQLSSPLTIATPEFGQSGLGGGASNGLEISGVVSGNNGITKTGPGTLWLTNTGNDFVGNIQIQDGILNVTNWAAIPSGDTLILGGDGTVGRLYLSSDTSAISRPIVLAGEGGEFFVTGWEGNGWPASAGDWTADATPTASTFTGVISGTGNLWIGQGYAATFQGTADNSYVGDTKVLGWANVLTTYRALNGNVSIEAGGRVDLASANNVDPTKSVYVGSFNMASPECNTLGILAVEGDFVPTLDPNSSGILSLLANMPGQMYEQGYTGPNINARLAVGAPQLGNGYMWKPALQVETDRQVPRTRRRVGILVQRRDAVVGNGEYPHRRNRQRRYRLAGYRRLARVDGDDHRGSARLAGDRRAADHRRHRFDRPYRRDRRKPRHFRNRDGGVRGRQGRRAPVDRARRQGLGEKARRGRIPRRQALRQGQRRAADVDQTARAPLPAHRWADHRSRERQRARRRAWICDDGRGRRSRSRHRQSASAAMHRRAGCRQGDSSQLRRRTDAGRNREGNRLGIERRVLLRRQGLVA